MASNNAVADSAVARLPEQADPRFISAVLEAHGEKRSALIAILGDIQEKYRYLPENALRIVADRTGIPLVEVYAAATFYHSFSLRPKGKHIVCCCLGTACHVRGGAGIADELQKQLRINPGETTPDMQFTFETVNCLGACALGPVVVVDGRYFSKVKKSDIRGILDSALAGFGPVEASDNSTFPIEATCPKCRRSLIDKAQKIDGLPSIRLTYANNGARGRIALSSLHGSHSVSLEPDVAPGYITGLVCPHCELELNGHWECYSCGAPMATININGGGQVHICSRRGCKNRLLDLEPLPPEIADCVR